MTEVKSPTVFISYSWAEQEYGCAWVEKFANKLRADGIDADVDMYHESPKEGWTSWMINKIKNSDFVLVVCTESYYNIVNTGQEIHSGLGRRFEGKLIQKQLYDNGCINDRFIPILPPNGSHKYIIDILNDYTPYSIYDDYNRLLKRLKGDNNHMPPLGQKKIKTLFSNLIDPELWGEAEWLGMSFVMDKHFAELPKVRFVFKNPEGAEKAFRHIIAHIGKDDNKEQLGISFITNEDNTGYYAHIYPLHHNIATKIEQQDDVLIDRCITLSKVRECASKDSIQNVDMLKRSYRIFNACYVEPAILVNGEFKVAEPLRFICRNVRFRNYNDITINDIDIAVRADLIKKPNRL